MLVSYCKSAIVDPDLIGSRSGSGSGPRKVKKAPQERKKVRNSCFKSGVRICAYIRVECMYKNKNKNIYFPQFAIQWYSHNSIDSIVSKCCIFQISRGEGRPDKARINTELDWINDKATFPSSYNSISYRECRNVWRRLEQYAVQLNLWFFLRRYWPCCPSKN